MITCGINLNKYTKNSRCFWVWNLLLPEKETVWFDTKTDKLELLSAAARLTAWVMQICKFLYILNNFRQNMSSFGQFYTCMKHYIHRVSNHSNKWHCLTIIRDLLALGKKNLLPHQIMSWFTFSLKSNNSYVRVSTAILEKNIKRFVILLFTCFFVWWRFLGRSIFIAIKHSLQHWAILHL